MTMSSEQPKEYTEYTLTMTLEVPSKMREECIRRYIHSQIFRDGWGEAFQTNYIHSKEFRVSKPRPHPAPAAEVCEEHSACRIPALCPETALAAKAERVRIIKELESWNPFQRTFGNVLESLRGNTESNPCEENGCTDTDDCDEVCDNRRIYSPAQVREAVSKAREDVLDAIIVNLESRKKAAADIEKSPCTHTKMSQRFGVARLVLSETQEFVESLRSTPQQSEQEQPR